VITIPRIINKEIPIILPYLLSGLLDSAVIRYAVTATIIIIVRIATSIIISTLHVCFLNLNYTKQNKNKNTFS